MKRMIAREPGGPEQMVLDEIPTPAPGPGEALVAMAISGVNFLDVYFRTGAYKSDRPTLVASGALKVRISGVYPLADAPARIAISRVAGRAARCSSRSD